MNKIKTELKKLIAKEKDLQNREDKPEVILIARLEVNSSDPSDNLVGVVLRKDLQKNEYMVHYQGKDGSYWSGAYLSNPIDAADVFMSRIDHAYISNSALSAGKR